MNRTRSKPTTYYAHTKPGSADPAEWQPLESHLHNVAELAAEFARPFGGEEWAYLAGLWHDLGKYSEAFQRKLYDANGIESHLETVPGKVVHSQAGGHWAQIQGWKGIDRILCWLIMGHHAGLADYSSTDSGAKALEPKMRKPQDSISVLGNVPDDLKQQSEPNPPKPLLNQADIAFFIRMLFSCVVDADFLDTEVFMDPARSRIRATPYPSMRELLDYFDAYMQQFCMNVDESEINRIRANILNQCRTASVGKPSVFSLTVPTGGGKTLASMAFALRHAVKWGKQRIIYVIPYTSIIEQTVDVYRKIQGFENAILEHHSNVQEDDESKESVAGRLAAENWDAPIVVTTSVQFFESLYACKTSRCRKLHNISESVVIFDEAQCLPPEHLRPIVFAIRELHRHYGVTPVLCTATQPVVTQRESFDFKFREGFENVTEIVDDPKTIFTQLNRVHVNAFANLAPTNYETIAESIMNEGQSVLCIVNRKDPDCRTLAECLPEEQTIYLSTNMCAGHRTVVFEDIRGRLKRDVKPLFVISTSLVEAGVDLDFPVVYRALTGLDSIAQAAGRCNREDRLSVKGRTIVFTPEEQPSYVRATASIAREYLVPERLRNLFTPEIFHRYFTQRFFQVGTDVLDKHGILALLNNHLEFAFRMVAERFRLIDDDWQMPLIVPYGQALEYVDRLVECQWDSRRMFRKLQRYTIAIPKAMHWKLMDEQHIHALESHPGVYILHNQALYSDRYGFVAPDSMIAYDIDTTIV